MRTLTYIGRPTHPRRPPRKPLAGPRAQSARPGDRHHHSPPTQRPCSMHRSPISITRAQPRSDRNSHPSNPLQPPPTTHPSRNFNTRPKGGRKLASTPQVRNPFAPTTCRDAPRPSQPKHHQRAFRFDATMYHPAMQAREVHPRDHPTTWSGRQLQHVPHSTYELALTRQVRNSLLPCTCRHAPRRTKRNVAFIVAHRCNKVPSR